MNESEAFERLERLEREPGKRTLKLTVENLGRGVYRSYRTTPRKQTEAFVGCKLYLKVRAWLKDEPMELFKLVFRHGLTGKEYRTIVMEMKITKPNNPVTVHYLSVDDNDNPDKPRLYMLGLYTATYSQGREMLKHAKEIKPYLPPGPQWKVEYDKAYERIKMGKNRQAVKSEFLKKHAVSSKGFNQAMWRRRQRDKRER